MLHRVPIKSNNTISPRTRLDKIKPQPSHAKMTHAPVSIHGLKTSHGKFRIEIDSERFLYNAPNKIAPMNDKRPITWSKPISYIHIVREKLNYNKMPGLISSLAFSRYEVSKLPKVNSRLVSLRKGIS